MKQGMEKSQIAVVDFGGQYAHLIAKRLRHLGSYSTILHPDAETDDFKGFKGLVLSGGPASVNDADAPEWNPALLQQPVPIPWIFRRIPGIFQGF